MSSEQTNHIQVNDTEIIFWPDFVEKQRRNVIEFPYRAEMIAYFFGKEVQGVTAQGKTFEALLELYRLNGWLNSGVTKEVVIEGPDVYITIKPNTHSY